MGIGDWIVEWNQNRMFKEGASLLGAAEALEESGHYGPAARLFAEAAYDLGVGRAVGSNVAYARGHSDSCARKAAARGENVQVAFSWPRDQLLQAPNPSMPDALFGVDAFIWVYYNQQHQPLLNKVAELMRQGKWQEILDLIKTIRRLKIPACTPNDFALEFRYLLAHHAGQASTWLDHPRKAVEHYRQAHAIKMKDCKANPDDEHSLDQLIGTCFRLGYALTKLGDASAVQYFRQLCELNEQHPLLGSDPQELVARSQNFIACYEAKSGNVGADELVQTARKAMDVTERLLKINIWDWAAEGIDTLDVALKRLDKLDPSRAEAILNEFSERVVQWFSAAPTEHVSKGIGWVPRILRPYAEAKLEARTLTRLLAIPAVQTNADAKRVIEDSVRSSEEKRCRSHLNSAKSAQQQSNFASAYDYLEQARQIASKLGEQDLIALVKQTAAETDLADPDRMAKHRAQLTEMLTNGSFDDADSFFQALYRAQRHHPDLPNIEAQIVAAKKGFVEETIPRIQAHLDGGNVRGARELLTRAQTLCRQTGRQSSELAALAVSVARRQAKDGIADCGRLANAGRLAEACAAVAAALVIPDLDDEAKQRLRKHEAALQAQRESNWVRAEAEIRQALAADNLNLAGETLQRTIDFLGELNRQEFIALARTCLDGPKEIQAAETALSQSKLEEAEKLLTPLLKLTEAPGVVNRAREVLDRIGGAQKDRDRKQMEALSAEANALIAKGEVRKAQEKINAIRKLRFGADFTGETEDLCARLQKMNERILCCYRPNASKSQQIVGGVSFGLIFIVLCWGVGWGFFISLEAAALIAWGLASLTECWKSHSYLIHDGGVHIADTIPAAAVYGVYLIISSAMRWSGAWWKGLLIFFVVMGVSEMILMTKWPASKPLDVKEEKKE